MKRTILKTLGAILLAVFLVVSFSGCEMLGLTNDDPSIVGYWVSSYGDGFEIKSESGEWMYYQYDDAAKEISFAGKIVDSKSFKQESRYITLEITEAGSWYKAEGEYYRVHYKNLSEDTVKGSSAYNMSSLPTTNDGLPTISEAESEFTIENDYFGYYGDYTRQ